MTAVRVFKGATVAELIALLQKMPPDASVCFAYDQMTAGVMGVALYDDGAVEILSDFWPTWADVQSLLIAPSCIPPRAKER